MDWFSMAADKGVQLSRSASPNLPRLFGTKPNETLICLLQYLSKRKFQVRMDGSLSSIYISLSVVPQGYMLCP